MYQILCLYHFSIKSSKVIEGGWIFLSSHGSEVYSGSLISLISITEEDACFFGGGFTGGIVGGTLISFFVFCFFFACYLIKKKLNQTADNVDGEEKKSRSFFKLLTKRFDSLSFNERSAYKHFPQFCS